MARITVEDCIDKFESRFELVLVAANRARKIHSGESPTVEKDNDKNTVIALREIADETLSVADLKENLVEEYQAVSMQTEEDMSLEYSDNEDPKSESDDNNIDINKDSVSSHEEVIPFPSVDNADAEDSEDEQLDNLSQKTEEETT